jgi:hypothetical protein
MLSGGTDIVRQLRTNVDYYSCLVTCLKQCNILNLDGTSVEQFINNYFFSVNVENNLLNEETTVLSIVTVPT